MKLFEINDAIKQVMDRDDLDSVTMKDTLDSLELTREEKLDSLAAVIEKCGAEDDFLTEKIRKLTDQKHFNQNRINNLQEYMTNILDEAKIKKLQTKNHILKPRNYRDKTIVSDGNLLPQEYKIKEEVVKIDRKKIYQDLKNGKEVAGAHLKPNRKTTIS
ncbi:siphovirus Gp157 family protein [Lactobacillus sp. ESL0679]|uniref:siphovirus Gp157 family protein n=1 Tax=Lactobacillus sp. ESL0679 TaxID=2983209 RepID=UPI0023F74F2F|nr:siphovirus Gp157 family protein [Lactobacillus sp. ESL0679]MDF7683379.1 siphovirus Gp157 family protein [Lactobacillus sp. ESL0679]